MKQYDIILSAMINNRNKKIWYAVDFQDKEKPYFVGYEASPRMSELSKIYPELLIKGWDGRFRTLEINWEYENINKFIEEYGICKN